MAMLGSSAPGNWADLLYMVGAGLKDASPGSQGGNLIAAQQLAMQRNAFQRQQQLLAQLPGLFGGQAGQAGVAPAPVMTDAGTGPTMKGPGEDGAPIGPAERAPTYAIPAAGAPAASSAPDFNRIAAVAPIYKAMGIDLASSIEALKAGQPDVAYDRGFGYNRKNGQAMGAFHPDLDKGIALTPDGAAPVPGYAAANAAIKGAEANAQEMAKAGWDVIPVSLYDGSTVQLPRAVVAAIQSQRAAAAGGVPAGFGRTQSTEAKAQAQKYGETMGSIVEKPNPAGGIDVGLGSDLYGGGTPAAAPAAGSAPGAGRVGQKPSPQDQKYRDDVATAAAGRYNNIIDAGRAAQGSIARLQGLNNLLKGYEGGALAPELYDISSGLNSLGFKVDPKLANKDAAQVLQRTMATEAMKNPDTGANMFPRVTNFEYENALKQVPGLMQSAAGREKVVAMKTAEQQRIQDISRFAQQWHDRFGRIDARDAKGKSFQDYLDTWSQQHPLYGAIPGMAAKK